MCHENPGSPTDDDSMILEAFDMGKSMIDKIPVPADLDQGAEPKGIYFSPPIKNVANSN